MDYYEQLYDINFFAEKYYTANVGMNSVIIRNPGIPDWKTWNSKSLDASLAEEVYQKLTNTNININIDAIRSEYNLSLNDYYLFVLLLCETSYRKGERDRFYYLNRILFSSGISELNFKSVKMQHGSVALDILTNSSSSPIDHIANQCLTYLHAQRREYTLENVVVETPVQIDWEKDKVTFNNPKSVKRFYKTTYSYILELTAANHQVETLFNYMIIIQLIKRLGIRELLDYGAGIGTFVVLAQSAGIKVKYLDLDSETKNYALYRFDDLGIDIDTYLDDYDGYKFGHNQKCIVCTEVLEHIYDPEELIDAAYKALNHKGIFVVSESFNYVDAFCAHMPKHFGKGDDVFEKYMEKMGFVKLDLGYETHPRVYMKE